MAAFASRPATRFSAIAEDMMREDRDILHALAK
jgi:hypothetical protein